MAAGALAGRYVLCGGKRVKVASNTAAKLVLEEAVTAALRSAGIEYSGVHRIEI